MTVTMLQTLSISNFFQTNPMVTCKAFIGYKRLKKVQMKVDISFKNDLQL